MMANGPAPIVRRAMELLHPHADQRRGREMAAYMRTAQPYLGAGEPARRPLYRMLGEEFKPASPAELARDVLSLWNAGRRDASLVVHPPVGATFRPRPGSTLLPPDDTGPRELQYCAIGHLERGKKLWQPRTLSLVKRLIIEGGWWDTVDWLSMRALCPLHLNHRAAIAPQMRDWVEDRNVWVRRAAMLSQLSHKGETDEQMLFAFARSLAGEKEFFIRKAIGWALRHYARTAPRNVTAFVKRHRSEFSTLTIREAAKHLEL